jgi:FkbM family methyltransferase
VLAFEPDPETFACLTSNTAEKSVTPVHAAVVGSPRATAKLYRSSILSTRNTLTGHEILSGEEIYDSVDVPTITLDDVLAVPCDLLKVDCEGAEFEMLSAVSDQALSRARRIILEFHRTAGDPETLIRRLGSAGFDTTILVGASPHEPIGLIGARR